MCHDDESSLAAALEEEEAWNPSQESLEEEESDSEDEHFRAWQIGMFERCCQVVATKRRAAAAATVSAFGDSDLYDFDRWQLGAVAVSRQAAAASQLPAIVDLTAEDLPPPTRGPAAPLPARPRPSPQPVTWEADAEERAARKRNKLVS